jgi:beta-carotene hydroxylase
LCRFREGFLRLRNSADYRTVLWVAMAAALSALQYVWPETILWVLPFSCYLGIACGVITHNHNHRPTFVGRRSNNAFGHILTLFYGYPTLMWIPTHNMNHHHFANRAGDATITWRYTNRHNLFVALTYFFVSAYFQSEPIQRYIRRAKLTNRHLYLRVMFQYAVWIGFLLLTLGLSIALHGLSRRAVLVWIFATIIPAVCSIVVIMFFNYTQHVHADASSEHNHSRNFTGKVFNYFFFNNGFHAAHHNQPGRHWSTLPAAHAQIDSLIDPRLKEGSLAWYLFRQYVVALILPRFATRQIGPDPQHAVAYAPANR